MGCIPTQPFLNTCADDSSRLCPSQAASPHWPPAHWRSLNAPTDTACPCNTCVTTMTTVETAQTKWAAVSATTKDLFSFLAGGQHRLFTLTQWLELNVPGKKQHESFRTSDDGVFTELNKRFTVFWFRQKNESKHYIGQNKNKCIVQSVGNMAWIYV